MIKFWSVDILRIITAYYVFAVVLAMFLYPGGNHIELDQVGYSLHKNFLSELGFHKTMSGDINVYVAFTRYSVSIYSKFVQRK